MKATPEQIKFYTSEIDKMYKELTDPDEIKKRQRAIVRETRKIQKKADYGL